MDFKNEDFNKFRKAMKEAVKSVEEEFQVEINFSNISYNNTSFTLKTEVFKESQASADFEYFKENCYLYDLKEEDFNKEVIINNSIYLLVGFNPSRPKNCIRLKEKLTGKIVFTTLNTIKCLLNK